MNLKKTRRLVFTWSKQIFLIVLATVFISVFVIQTYDINDISMEPTFDRQGNRVLVFLTPYYFGFEPAHSEVVIIDSRVERERTIKDKFIESPVISIITGTRNQHLWVKRVIGLSGDQLEYVDGKIFRNGLEIVEDYTLATMDHEFETVVIPEGYVYVMGDNRNRSSDSRQIGPVPISNIQGRVVLRFIPLAKISTY